MLICFGSNEQQIGELMLICFGSNEQQIGELMLACFGSNEQKWGAYAVVLPQTVVVESWTSSRTKKGGSWKVG